MARQRLGLPQDGRIGEDVLRLEEKVGGLGVSAWAYEHGVSMDFSRPGKPTDNPHIELFNGSFRDECLNIH